MTLTADPNSVPNREWGPNSKLTEWIASNFWPGYAGYAVDVGASDGISVNSTYMLEQARWTVLSIEPNPIFWEKLKRRRAFVMTCACDAEPQEAASFHSFDHNPEAYSALRPTKPPNFPDKPAWTWSTITVRVKTLEQCLEEAQFPKLDVLTVDVEGNEQDVLRGIDLAKWKPRVVVVEAWDEGKHDEYLKGFGYKRQWRTIHNDCYALKGSPKDGQDQTG